MKKTLLSLFAVAAVAVSLNADPRFGMVAYTEGGIGQFQPGIIVVDDMYTASLAFNSTSDEDNGEDKDAETSFTLGANYKMALDANNAGTFGVSYATQSGDTHKTNTTLRVLAGIERNLGNNLLLTLEAIVYESKTLELKAGGGEDKESNLLAGGRFGLAYLF